MIAVSLPTSPASDTPPFLKIRAFNRRARRSFPLSDCLMQLFALGRAPTHAILLYQNLLRNRARLYRESSP
jgi:hypothetical protein